MRQLFLCVFLHVFFFLNSAIVNAQEEIYSYFYYDREIKLNPSGDKYFIKFKNEVSSTHALLSLTNFIIYDSIKSQIIPQHYCVKYSIKDNEAIAKLRNDKNIEYVMPIFISGNGIEKSMLNQFIVKFKEGVSLENIGRLNNEYKVSVLQDLDEWNKGVTLLLGLDAKCKYNVLEISKIYNSLNLVEYASPNFIVFNGLSTTTPTDDLYPNQWALTKIRAANAWDISTGSSNITVAVLDNGVDLTHPEFNGKLVQGYDYVDNDNNPQSVGNYAHGTACAGIIGARANNGGIAGLAWNCKIMPIRVVGGNSWESATVVNGINFAKNNSADILSCSFNGGVEDEAPITNAINNALNYGRNGKGCIVAFSSSNFGTETFPATIGSVLSVGATTQNDTKWGYSGGGPHLRVVAPSGDVGTGDITSTDIVGPNGYSSTDYTSTFGGTSAACPLAAGLAALVLSKDPTLTRWQVQTIIEQTAIDLPPAGRDDDYGWGRIDAWNAMRITTSGALPGNEVWRGTINITDNITVPAGIKLTILSNATINLGSHSIISTGGTIIKESGATINGLKATLTCNSAIRSICGTVQAAANAITDNDYGNTYELGLNGSTNESISLTNKCGVHFYGTGSNSISGTLSITNCESCSFNGFTAQNISLSGCVLPLLRGISVTYGSGNESLYAYNCTNFYYSGGTITHVYGNGITLNQSSTSTINESNDYTLFYNNNRGIKTQSGSTADIDNVHFCSNNSYDLVANSGTSMTADYCWFLNSTPLTSGSVTTLYNQSFTDCASMGKKTASSLLTFSVEDSPAKDELTLINDKNFELGKKVRDDIDCNGSYDAEKYRGNYTDVVNSYNNFINKYPSSEYAKTALVSAVHIYRTLKDYEEMNSFLQSIIADKNLANESSLAKRFMIEYYTAQKDYTSAIKTADEIISSKDTNLICDALYAKGMLYQYSMDKKSGAIECYQQILKEYPDNSLVTLAETELGFLDVKVEKGQKETETSTTESIAFGSSNYPNPFNPTTSISYTLPEEGRVQIKVFDALGRELTTLLDDEVSAGKHTIDWNGSNAASGIYFYSISFKGQMLYKKMLLVK